MISESSWLISAWKAKVSTSPSAWRETHARTRTHTHTHTPVSAPDQAAAQGFGMPALKARARSGRNGLGWDFRSARSSERGWDARGAYDVSQTLRVVAQARKRCRAPGQRVSYHGALLWCSFDLVHGLYGFSDLLEGSACVASRQDCWDFTPVFGGSLIRRICTGSTSKSCVGERCMGQSLGLGPV